MTAKILKHKFVSAVADGADATVVRPSNWNDEHNFWLGSRTVTGTTDTLVHADHLSLVSYNNAGAIAVSLSAPAGGNMPSGWRMRLRNIGAGNVTITGSSATINGSASVVLATGNVLDLHSLGTSDYGGIIPVTRGGNNIFTGTNDVSVAQIKGTATNDAAAAGYVGQYVEQIRLLANRFFISATTYTGITATPINLTPGDWDVWGAIHMVFTGGTVARYSYGFLTNVAPPGAPPTQHACFKSQDTYIGIGSVSASMQLGPARISVAAPEDWYLVSYLQFNGNCEVFGTLSARRIR